MDQNLVYDILTLPTVNKAIMNHLNRADRLNFSIALNDYAELENCARSRARTRYRRDEENRYVDSSIKYLLDVEECVSQMFVHFPEIKNMKIVTTLPYESSASFFGLDDTEVDEELFSDESDTSDSEDDEDSAEDNDTRNRKRKSAGGSRRGHKQSSRPTTTLEERYIKITFTYNDARHGTDAFRRSSIEGRMYSLLAMKLSGDNTSIETETNLGESVLTSFDNSFVSMAPFYTRYAEPNRVVFSKIFMRPETDRYCYSKWSVVITGFLYECKKSRAARPKLSMKLRNDDKAAVALNYSKRIPFDTRKVIEYVPSHLKRKSYLEFDRDAIPLQYFDIVLDFVAKTEIFSACKQFWQSVFYEPLLLYRNTVSVPNARYYSFTHIRETDKHDFVVSENVSFTNKRVPCNRTLLRLDGSRTVCDEATRQIAINEFNKIDIRKRVISSRYFTSVYHSFSHSPVVNPFVPNSSRLSKRSSETVSRYVKRLKAC